MPAPTIDELIVADDPARWAALGFDVTDHSSQIGSVRLRFLAPAGGSPDGPDAPAPATTAPGIVGWSLRDAQSTELDGLATTLSERPLAEPAPAHPNGVRAIDHVVAASPDLDRSVAALQAAGLDLGGADHPVRFWGLALLVDDLDAAAERLAPQVGEPRAAVQPGRRIATVRRSAGLTVPMALMSADERAKEER